MRCLLVLAAGLALSGCCCSVVTVNRAENGRCFRDRYNCNVSPLTFLSSTEVPCTCEFQECTSDSDCAQAAACQEEVACDGGDAAGASAICAASNACTFRWDGAGACAGRTDGG